MRRTFRGDGEPSEALWRDIGLGCTRGDAPADALVRWMTDAGMGRAYATFERALDEGIAAIPDPSDALRGFFAEAERRPVWLDDALVAEGIRVCRISGVRGTFTMRDGALMGGYQSSAINRTLVLTGALSRGASARVAETVRWWDACMDDGGMTRFGEGFKATLRVRVVHALVRAKLARSSEWDARVFGLPINQTDMALTYLTFSALYLAGQRALGVPIGRAEGEAAMHVWRYIGRLMGVEERWLCATERDGRVLLYRMLLAQAPPDESGVALARALLEEPLERPCAAYGPLAPARRRFLRAAHLSNTSLFVGAKGLAALGLPRALPWYPLLTLPLVFARHALHRLVPGGRARLVRLGRSPTGKCRPRPAPPACRCRSGAGPAQSSCEARASMREPKAKASDRAGATAGPEVPADVTAVAVRADAIDAEYAEVSIEEAELVEVRVPRLRLSQSRLTRGDLTQSYLAQFHANDVEIEDCNLSNVRLPDAIFSSVLVARCKLQGAHVLKGSFAHVTFRDCRLDLASLEDVRFKSVTFERCLFRESDFDRVTFERTLFLDCDFTRASFVRMKVDRSEMRRCDLGEVRGVAELRGVGMELNDLLAHAQLFATELGIRTIA